jgi:hypothetical protein
MGPQFEPMLCNFGNSLQWQVVRPDPFRPARDRWLQLAGLLAHYPALLGELAMQRGPELPNLHSAMLPRLLRPIYP